MSDDTTGDTMPATTGRQATREATSVRHVRVGDAAWREAATRAKREGRGVAEVVRALVTAYAAGDLEAPAPTQTSTDRPADPAPVRRLCDPTDQHVDPVPTLADPLGIVTANPKKTCPAARFGRPHMWATGAFYVEGNLIQTDDYVKCAACGQVERD